MPDAIGEGGARKGSALFFVEDNPEPVFLELLSPSRSIRLTISCNVYGTSAVLTLPRASHMIYVNRRKESCMSRNKLIGIIAACVVIIIVVVVITMPGDPPSTLEPGPEDGNGHEQPPTTTPEATEATVAFTGVGGIHLINLDGSDELHPVEAPGGIG